MTLTAMIKQLEDIMRADTGIDGTAQRLSQIVWLLFLKAFDYNERLNELQQEDYIPVIPEGYRWRDWADPELKKEQRTDEDLIDFVNNKLFPVLRGEPIANALGEREVLFASEEPRAQLVKDFMARSHNYSALFC